MDNSRDIDTSNDPRSIYYKKDSLNNPLSSDFSYKKYSLEQLDNWVNDALNCEDLTPQDIYETITNVVEESVEYHKKFLDKSVELLSLLKGHRPSQFDNVTLGSQDDYDDFWNSNA